MIEKHFDVPFIAELALREKQVQQNYRPIIAVHKWFARRPGTLFRGLLLSEFATDGALREVFYRSHDLTGKRVYDPFMGGGTPLIEANRLGCDVIGYDINPMAYWIVRQEIGNLDLGAYRSACVRLREELEGAVGPLYRTTCLECGSDAAHVKYFIWVKEQPCVRCGRQITLFPGYLLAEDKRHPRNVLICAACGRLNEATSTRDPGHCSSCGHRLQVRGPATRNHCPCPGCGEVNTYPNAALGVPKHRMVAIEYHCPRCKPGHTGRFFKTPDASDQARYASAVERWQALQPEFVPADPIPRGDETDRLHRWGYTYYRDMFNERQLLGLELSCRVIAQHDEGRVREALATNLSDLLRYQNMLCRYDTMALKSLDVFSVHGFPVGLVQCESNLLGITNGREGTSVGSGGWSNIIDKFISAKEYCEAPFEIRHVAQRKVLVPTHGEGIGEVGTGSNRGRRRVVDLRCGSCTDAEIEPGSLDAVLTDPPYYSNVQYAELMDFCYVWLRRLVGYATTCFAEPTTRSMNELTGNATMERGLVHFTEGLSAAFQKIATALKPGAPLAFTYHHNTIEAYLPVAVALLDAGLTCSASIPCPAEMSASIHINGTGSSIIDTVFVCRSRGAVARSSLADDLDGLARLVERDALLLRLAGLRPTRGDLRCISHGHVTRLAIWNLRGAWAKDVCTMERLARVQDEVRRIGDWRELSSRLSVDLAQAPLLQAWAVHEQSVPYESEQSDEISF
ncbi:MAG: DUF1156 domain-containing protein [Anaerolineae bacterium]